MSPQNDSEGVSLPPGSPYLTPVACWKTASCFPAGHFGVIYGVFPPASPIKFDRPIMNLGYPSLIGRTGIEEELGACEATSMTPDILGCFGEVPDHMRRGSER